MLTRLLSALSTAKGAAAATVIAAAAVGTGVVATNTDVQNTLGDTVHGAVNTSHPEASASGQPAVVASRNAADKKLRDAFQDDQKALEPLRGTKVAPADRGKLEDTIKTADSAPRARLSKALNDVAALTLGREGLESASPTPTGSPTVSASPDVKASFSPATQAKVDAIVSTAINDMAKTLSDAETAVAALPTSEHGKPSGQPGAKPSNAGKPSELPAHATPTAKPTR